MQSADHFPLKKKLKSVSEVAQEHDESTECFSKDLQKPRIEDRADANAFVEMMEKG